MGTKISDANKYCPIFIPALYWKDSITTKRHFLFALLDSLSKATDCVIDSEAQETEDVIKFKSNFTDTCKQEFYKYVNGCNSNGPYIDSDKQFERACTSFIYLYNMTCEPIEPVDIHQIISDISDHINKINTSFNILRDLGTSKISGDQIIMYRTAIMEDLEHLKQFNHLSLLSAIFDTIDKYSSENTLWDTNKLGSVVKALNGVSQMLCMSIPFYVGYIKQILAAYYDKKGLRLLSWWCKQRIDIYNSGMPVEAKQDYSSDFDFVDMQGNLRRLYFDNPFIEAHILAFNVLCYLIAKLGLLYKDVMPLFLENHISQNTRVFSNITEKNTTTISTAISLCEAIEEQILAMKHRITSLSSCKIVGKPEGINIKWNKDLNELQNNWVIYINRYPKGIYKEEDDDYFSLGDDDDDDDGDYIKNPDDNSSDSNSDDNKTSNGTEKNANTRFYDHIKVPVLEYKFVDGVGFNKVGPTTIKISNSTDEGSIHKKEHEYANQLNSHLTNLDKEIMRSSNKYLVFGCDLSWIHSDKHCNHQCEKCHIDITRFRSRAKNERKNLFVGDKVKEHLDRKILECIPTFLCLDYYDILYDSVMATKMELTGLLHMKEMFTKRHKCLSEISTMLLKYRMEVISNDIQQHSEIELCDKILSCSGDVEYFEQHFALARQYHKTIQEFYVEAREQSIHKKSSKNKFRCFALAKRSSIHVISKTRQIICDLLSNLTPTSLFNVVIKHISRFEQSMVRMPLYLIIPTNSSFKFCIADLHNNFYKEHLEKRQLLIERLNDALNYTLPISNVLDKKTVTYASKISAGLANITPSIVSQMVTNYIHPSVVNKKQLDDTLASNSDDGEENQGQYDDDIEGTKIKSYGSQKTNDVNGTKSHLETSITTVPMLTSDKARLSSTTDYIYNEPSRIGDAYQNYNNIEIMDIEYNNEGDSSSGHTINTDEQDNQLHTTFSNETMYQLNSCNRPEIDTTVQNDLEDVNLFALIRYKMETESSNNASYRFNQHSDIDDELSIIKNDALHYLRPFFEKIYQLICNVHIQANTIFPVAENNFLSSTDYTQWIIKERLSLTSSGLSQDENLISGIIDKHYQHFGGYAREKEGQIIKREKIKTDGFFRVIHTLNVPLLKLLHAYIMSATFKTPRERQTTNTLSDTHIFLCGFYKIREDENNEE